MSTSLWIGAAWIVVSTAGVLCVRDIRGFRIRGLAEPASAVAAG
jgi:hypothetical protein